MAFPQDLSQRGKGTPTLLGIEIEDAKDPRRFTEQSVGLFKRHIRRGRTGLQLGVCLRRDLEVAAELIHRLANKLEAISRGFRAP